MSFPAWDLFLSNSLLIAVVAILHVFVSHFAIGGGLYLVLAESWARRRGDAGQLAYLERYSRFFVLVTLVFGAVSGVGIWITIGLIHPAGTRWLITNFVWGWATEWVMFFLEITAAMLYLYGWKRLEPKLHLAIGWVYFVTAWLSLVIINGILTFMLTPGRWPQTGQFWDGFFNPSFLPATVFRTCVCLTLAGLYASLTAAAEPDRALRVRLLRFNGAVIAGSLLLALPAGWWYFRALPPEVAALLRTARVPVLAVEVMLVSAAALLALALLGLLVFPARFGRVAAVVLMGLGLAAMGGFEWAREAIRKPFIINNFLYSNGLLMAEAAQLPAREPLPVAFRTGDRGRDLFLQTCSSCHSVDGYKGLRGLAAGLDAAHLANIIPRLQHYLEKMPPFPGDGADALALAAFVKARAAPDPLETRPGLTGAEKARLVFTRRCGGCHTLSGTRPLAESFAGLTEPDAADLLASIGDFTEEMPPFTGSDEERRWLIRFMTGGPK